MHRVRRTIRRNATKVLSGLDRVFSYLEGGLKGNAITAYWYTGVVNFGDLITPLLLRHYGFTPVHYPVHRAQLLSAGSILHLAPENYSGHILGSGLIEDTRRPFKNAMIWAARGELTRERIDAPIGTILGDPGLLSSKVLDRRMSKRFALGFVPHYVDRDDARITSIVQRYRDDIFLVDVMRDPLAVLQDLDKCDAVLSSSLHGIVAADSLNIPNAWVYLSDAVIGRGFKFHDYASAFGRKIVPNRIDGRESLSELLTYTAQPSEMIEVVQERLDGAFKSLRSYFESE